VPVMTVIDPSPLFFHGLFAPFRTEAQLLKLVAEASRRTTLFAIPASASAAPPAPAAPAAPAAPPAPPMPALPPISPDPAAPPAPDVPLVVDSPPVPVGPVVAEPPAPAVPEPSPPVAPGVTLTVEPSSVPPELHASKHAETTESPSNETKRDSRMWGPLLQAVMVVRIWGRGTSRGHARCDLILSRLRPPDIRATESTKKVTPRATSHEPSKSSPRGLAWRQ
jgi:hypothetical protein